MNDYTRTVDLAYALEILGIETREEAAALEQEYPRGRLPWFGRGAGHLARW
jgi:hypothetical protein